MKTQLSKPARSKARYTEEYKKEALELWRASGRSAAKVAAELGIRPPLLSRWPVGARVQVIQVGLLRRGRIVPFLSKDGVAELAEALDSKSRCYARERPAH
jgi:transposase-like protein